MFALNLSSSLKFHLGEIIINYFILFSLCLVLLVKSFKKLKKNDWHGIFWLMTVLFLFILFLLVKIMFSQKNSDLKLIVAVALMIVSSFLFAACLDRTRKYYKELNLKEVWIIAILALVAFYFSLITFAYRFYKIKNLNIAASVYDIETGKGNDIETGEGGKPLNLPLTVSITP